MGRQVRRRNFGRGASSWHNAISGAVGLYQRFRQRGNRKRFSRNKTGAGHSGQGVTSHFDKRTIYRFKRAPRWKKKKARFQAKKWRANLLHSLGNSTVVYNSAVNDQVSNSAQGTLIAHLYGLIGTNSTVETGTHDISDVFAGDARLSGSSQLYFESAVLDLTVTNTSPGGENVYGGALEVDVYEVWHYDNTIQPGLLPAVQSAWTTADPILPSAAIGNIAQRGVTLFEAIGGLMLTKAKIVKKTKVFLPQFSSFTYQIRDPRNHHMACLDISSNEATGFAQKKMTKSVYVIFKAVSGLAGNGVSAAMGATRRYTYKLLENKELLTAYN